MSKTGSDMTLSFDPGALTLDEIERRTGDMWADLPWDKDSLTRLKRDGLILDGINLGGACPYRLSLDATGQALVSAIPADHAAALLDLWRLHFLRGFRPRSLAA